MPSRILPGLILACLLFCGPLSASEPVRAPRPDDAVLLRYKFETGDVLRYGVAHDAVLHTKQRDFSEANRNIAQQLKHFRVVAIDVEGNAWVEATIDRVRMTVQFDGSEPTVYDSADKSTPPRQFRALHATVGTPQARGRFSPRGELLEILPLKGANATPDPEAMNFLVKLPEEPVSLGSRWTESLTVPVNIPGFKTVTQDVTLHRVYAVQKIEGPRVTISVRTGLLTPVTSPAIQAQLIQRMPEGEIVFDAHAGRILSRMLITDGEVIGALGPQSKMSAKSKFVERLKSE